MRYLRTQPRPAKRACISTPFPGDSKAQYNMKSTGLAVLVQVSIAEMKWSERTHWVHEVTGVRVWPQATILGPSPFSLAYNLTAQYLWQILVLVPILHILIPTLYFGTYFLLYKICLYRIYHTVIPTLLSLISNRSCISDCQDNSQ